MSGSIVISFEGTPIAARAGESVASALAAHGVLSLRTTRDGAERGMFCGMGVCQDCLVEIDGKPEQRACMTKVDQPMRVRRQVHGRPLAPVAEIASPVGEVAVERPEVLVIGAGPGGLSAAIAARRAGAAVIVVDERAQPGGQYFKQLSVDAVAAPDRQHREGAALIETAVRLGVEIRSGVTIWGAFEPGLFTAATERGSQRLAPKATIVATGAYERGWPVPGWTLPGVMTTGAAQTLWRTAHRLPGRRVLIAGNGPLNLQLAAELIDGGAEVVAVIEAAPQPGPVKLAALVTMLATAPELVYDGLGYHWRRRAGGAEMIHGSVVSSVTKSARGLTVQLDGAQRSFEVDVLCLGYGFEPANELLRVLGCGHEIDPARRQLVTRRDDCGRTDVAGIYALGDCTGLGGARAALAEGTIVGLSVAQDLGRAIDVAQRDRAQAMLRRHRRFQRALWDLYAAPPYSIRRATAETVICRCEEVTLGQIEQALAENIASAGAIKRRTRLGMGRCQGRYCAPLLEALLTERLGTARGEFTGFAPRVPVKPIAIGELVR